MLENGVHNGLKQRSGTLGFTGYYYWIHTYNGFPGNHPLTAKYIFPAVQ